LIVCSCLCAIWLCAPVYVLFDCVPLFMCYFCHIVLQSRVCGDYYKKLLWPFFVTCGCVV